MKIQIGNNTIELKRKFRSYVIYEAITGHIFQPKNLTDFMFYFYSVILACSPDIELTMSDFMDWLDNNETAFNDFITWLEAGDSIEGQFVNNETENQKKNSNQ